MKGFKDLKFEGREERLTSTGGTIGFDPLHQAFEIAIGLRHNTQLRNFQLPLRRGMRRTHVNFLEYLEHDADFGLIK